jgi:integrase
VGSLGEGRDPERPVRDQALTTVDADGPASQLAQRAPLISRSHADAGCAIRIANKGTDTRLIQDFLGHASIANTVRYTKLAPGRLAAVRVR